MMISAVDVPKQEASCLSTQDESQEDKMQTLQDQEPAASEPDGDKLDSGGKSIDHKVSEADQNIGQDSTIELEDDDNEDDNNEDVGDHDEDNDDQDDDDDESELPQLVEKSLIIHRDENGFGLRLKGQAPVLVEHVHENGAAWRTGVRKGDVVSKVNGIPVGQLDHKSVVLMFKGYARFVGLTLFSAASDFELASMRRSLNLARRSSGLQFWSSSLIGSLPMAVGLATSATSRPPRNQRPIATGQPSSRLIELMGEQQQQMSSSSFSNLLLQSHAINGPTLAGHRLARHHQLDPQLHRAYGSLRDSRSQTAKKGLGHQVTSGDQSMSELQPQRLRQQQQAQQQHILKQQQFYQLRQSASTNSLPSVAASAQSVASKTGAAQVAACGETRQRQLNRRLETIREFIDTEKAHTDKLKLLDELFYKPLKAGGYMTSEQLRAIFSCHRTLYKVHRQIWRVLASANDSSLYGLEPMLGSALLEIFEGPLKRRLERAACSYCSAQSTNTELLNKLTRKDTKLGEFVAQVTNQQMIGRLGIKDLLASCFQRLTKYPLLLENLLKATPQKATVSMLPGGGYQLASHDNNNNDNKDNDEQQHHQQASDLAATSESQVQALRLSAISLAEEREFIERALVQSRQILFKVNEAIRVAMSRNKLKEIWKRTDKYPGVPLIDITNQQVVHEGLLTLRLSKRSFDVYMLLLNDYIIILTREGHDKYRLKFFTPANSQTVFSPVFVIDEHLTTRDAATDENGFYLLCKRKDDSRIYEFASRSPAERLKWRDRIQWTIERQMVRDQNRRPSCESTVTKSSSEISGKHDSDDAPYEHQQQTSNKFAAISPDQADNQTASGGSAAPPEGEPLQPEMSPKDDDHQKLSHRVTRKARDQTAVAAAAAAANDDDDDEDDKERNLEGTISYVLDDGIILPSMLELSQVSVNQATQLLTIGCQELPVAANKGALAESVVIGHR